MPPAVPPVSTVVGFISFIVYANCLPLNSVATQEDGVGWQQLATTYLHKFGYLEDAASQNIESAVGAFQKDMGLQSTSRLDQETIDLMKRPRCGNEINTDGRRRKRFVPHKRIWPQSTLTWKFEDPYNMVGSYETFIIRNTLHRAFTDWSVATRGALRFIELATANQTTNFMVLFAKGPHNDSLPFDGAGGVVAHGFYPLDGNLHFDAAEKWSLNLNDGVNLYQTAVHEIGHLLGLEHSNDYKSVMFPVNRPYDPLYQLGDDDIRGIRYLYAPWAWSLIRRPNEALSNEAGKIAKEQRPLYSKDNFA